MRKARFKPEHVPFFCHLYNRVAGEPGLLPFGPREKAHFVRLLHKLSVFFSIRVCSYQVMSNHFHLIVQVPSQPPSPQEVCRRYNAYYPRRPKLDPSDPRCVELALRMRDISWFMHALQQQFSTWFNRSRPQRRRGTLWAQRFKHTLLGGARAVWECCKYIQMNPVRAGLVPNPADYRFGSYGTWCGTGLHPFQNHIREVLLPWLQGLYPFRSLEQLRQAMAGAFAEIQGVVHQEPDGQILRFALHLDRRVRYWADGLVIGSELFIQDMISRSRGHLRSRTRGVVRALGMNQKPLPLCCYKQLRAIA